MDVTLPPTNSPALNSSSCFIHVTVEFRNECGTVALVFGYLERMSEVPRSGFKAAPRFSNGCYSPIIRKLGVALGA